MTGEINESLNVSMEAGACEQYPNISNICLSSLENTSASKARLRQLLRQIEKEYENILIENVALRKELERYTVLSSANTNNNNSNIATTTNNNVYGTTINKLKASNLIPMIRNRVVLRTGNQSDDLYFTSNDQHRDVIWDVQINSFDDSYLVSASADRTSNIWCRKTCRSIVQYHGHSGSVNSCRFQPAEKNLVATASGDHELHIWKFSIDAHKDDDDEDNEINQQIIRTPLLALRADDILSCADWLQTDQIVSASWDRSATIWQIEMGTSLRTLYGHDRELTHVSSHQTKPLVITSSRDGTFRLWDCRTPSHSVQIFIGHTKSVNSALFLGGDRLVSSSDDGFVHIWDSRSTTYSPLISLECVSPCNRLSLSNDILAVPLDNRDIRLYSTINGDKLYVQRRAHSRAVQCTAIAQLNNSMELILASGSLDCHMHVWMIKKLKGLNNNNNKAIKPIDELNGQIQTNLTLETNKNGNNNDSQSKKIMKKANTNDKSNNQLSLTERKQTSFHSSSTSDKQIHRTLSTTAK